MTPPSPKPEAPVYVVVKMTMEERDARAGKDDGFAPGFDPERPGELAEQQDAAYQRASEKFSDACRAALDGSNGAEPGWVCPLHGILLDRCRCKSDVLPVLVIRLEKP